MTQEELAKATGLSVDMISLLESERIKSMGSKVLLRIANALGVEIDIFLYPESKWMDIAE